MIMELKNLETELSKIFKYERNICSLLEKLIEVNNKDNKVAHFNVKINNGTYESQIPFIGSVNEKIGTELVYYIPDKEIIEEGLELEKPFHQYQDCNKTYYGILTNCLALMSGKNVKKISLIQMWGNKVINIKVKPLVAEYVLGNLYKITQENNKEKKEELLFDKNQTAIMFTY